MIQINLHPVFCLHYKVKKISLKGSCARLLVLVMEGVDLVAADDNGKAFDSR